MSIFNMNKGFIKISDVLYKEDWSSLYIFMKDFRPTYIEFKHYVDGFCYMYGVSDKFEPLKKGDAFPQYDVIFTRQQDGTLAYEFKRV